MAGAGGRSTPDLIEELFQHPEQFDFFQAVRLIEQAVAEQDRAQKAGRVGGDDGPQAEPIRFRALPSLTFPAGDISSLQSASDVARTTRNPRESESPGDRPRSSDLILPASQDQPDSAAKLTWPVEMTVPFMGLTGPNGVLPQHYTSLVIERSHLRLKDHTLREFFDLFNHRAISLFYRAWEKYRFPYAFERVLRDDLHEDDLFTSCLFSLVGQGQRSLRERFHFDDHAILFYGGLFAARTRNACCLEQCLGDYFGFSSQVIQFCGQWLYLPEESQTSMPSSRIRAGLNCCLGENTVAGSQVWDVQSRIRVAVGPLNWREFEQLLPGQDRLSAVAELIRLYIGMELEFDIQLILRREDVPLCQLADGHGYQPMLGWNTWIGGAADSVSDADDAIFRF